MQFLRYFLAFCFLAAVSTWALAQSVDGEDCDAIDAGLLLNPTTGRLWCAYGTYFGYIRMVEPNPATGKRKEGNEAVNVAIDCEGTDRTLSAAEGGNVECEPAFQQRQLQVEFQSALMLKYIDLFYQKR